MEDRQAAAKPGNTAPATPEAKTEPDRAGEERGRQAAWERLATGERLADQRDRTANQREAVADEREREADRREREADQREAALIERLREVDERERALDEHRRALGEVTKTLEERALEAIERSRELLALKRRSASSGLLPRDQMRAWMSAAKAVGCVSVGVLGWTGLVVSSRHRRNARGLLACSV